MAEPTNIVNRVKVTGRVSSMMDAFYASMLGSRSVCWCVGACPYEMFSAADVARFQTENSSARIAAAQEQERFFEYAEKYGLGRDGCSYARINIGQALLMADGLDSQIQERFRLPRPDMVFALNTCPTMIQWANCLVEVFEVPIFVVDAPFFYDEENNWDRNIRYVKSQLEDLVIFLENATGRPYDWQALKDILYGIRQMSTLRRQILELCKEKPAPASFIDAAVAFGPANTIRDSGSVDFYRDFLEEVAWRVKNNVGVLKHEKYRLMWRGNFPWFKLGTISRMLAKYGAVLVSGSYAFHIYGDVARQYIPPDGFDLDDPLWTIAAEHCARSYTRTFQWKLQQEFRDFIDGFSVDGVIIHSPHTCRPWTLATYDLAEAVKNEYGLPVLVLDSDHTDPDFFQDGRVEGKIQSLLEVIDSKRHANGMDL